MGNGACVRRNSSYFAVGKRINLRPRPKNDIYSIAEDWLNDNEIESEEDLIIE